MSVQINNTLNNQTDVMHAYTKAVEFKGQNIVVSASAGCGKTTTMIKRIISIIASGEAEVDELLVVTFTRAAAQEMKHKLKNELLKRAASNTDQQRNFFKTQADKCDLSDISTIHSFCSNVCREFFTISGLTPDFKVMEENQSQLYRRRALDKVLEEGYQTGANNIFELSGIFERNRSDDELASTINRLYEFASTMPDGEKLLNDCTDDNCNALDSVFVKYLHNLIIEITEQVRYKVSSFIPRTISEGITADQELLESICNGLLNISAQNDILTNIDGLEAFCQTKFKVKGLSKSKTFTNDYAHSIVKNLREYAVKQISTLYEGVSSLKNPDRDTLLKNMHEHIKSICSAALSYNNLYRDLKKSAGLLDFGDLEYYTLKILSDTTASDKLKKRYKYIFVDEFQDTNRVQDEIISSLNNGSNIFIVGDKKQSIYGFRGADSSIFTEKTSQPDYEKIILNRNFRSDKNILEFVNLVFSSCMNSSFSGINYKIDGSLWGDSELNFNDKLPAVVIDVANVNTEKAEKQSEGLYSVAAHYEQLKQNTAEKIPSESVLIARRIKELINNKTPLNLNEQQLKERELLGKSRYVEYGDITILVRTKRAFTQSLHDGLTSLGIPVSAEYAYSIKDYPEIMLLCDYLKIIENPRQDIPLASVLNSVFCGLNENELAEIKASNPALRFYESAILLAGESAKIFSADNTLQQDTKIDILILLEKLKSENSNCTEEASESQILKLQQVQDEIAATISELSEDININKKDSINEKLSDFFAKLTRYHIMSKSLPVSELILSIISENNYLDYLKTLKNGEDKAHRVTLFSEIIYDNQDTRTTSELLRFVDTAGEKIKLPPKSDASVNKVHLCTIHYSKGLEYPVVFIAGCGEEFLFLDSKGKLLFDRQLGLAMDFYDSTNKSYIKSFAKYALKHKINANQVREEINTLYVAMTRAKCRLYLVGSYNTEGFVPLLGANDLANARCYFDLALNDILAERSDMLFNLASDKTRSAKYEYNEYNNIVIDESERLKAIESISLEEISPLNCYKNRNAVSVPLKNTVTQSANLLNDISYEVESPNVLFFEKTNSLSSTSIESGNAYHKLLEFIDFRIDDCTDFLQNTELLTEQEKLLIDVKHINKILTLPIIKSFANEKIYKEQAFMCQINSRHLGYNYDGDVLLQGVIDMLVKTENGFIIVDYKHSAGSNEYLIHKYSSQINLYIKAVEQITGLKNLGAYILKIPTAEIIEIKPQI